LFNLNIPSVVEKTLDLLEAKHVGHVPGNKALVSSTLVEESLACNSLLIHIKKGDDGDGMKALGFVNVILLQ
jgi:hypothetical protein